MAYDDDPQLSSYVLSRLPRVSVVGQYNPPQTLPNPPTSLQDL